MTTPTVTSPLGESIVSRLISGALAVPAMNGYAVPEMLTTAVARLAALDAVVNAPEPRVPVVAEDPAQVRKVLAAAARAFHEDRDVREAARTLRPAFLGEVLGVVIAHGCRPWLDALRVDFDAAWKVFLEAYGKAPDALTSYSTDADAKAHVAALKSIDSLDRLLSCRAALGATVREEGADPRNVLLVAELPPVPTEGRIGDMWNRHTALLSTWSGGSLPIGHQEPATGLDKWSALARAGWTVGLADVDELTSRNLRAQEWADAAHSWGAAGGVAAGLSADRPDAWRTVQGGSGHGW